MQRNWELVRVILTALEQQETTHGGIAPEKIPGFLPEVVSYHFHILNEAGLIEATGLNSSNAPMHYLGRNLTWAGHEFLDSIRNDTMWKKIKATATSKGIDLSFDVIKQAAGIVIKGLLSS